MNYQSFVSANGFLINTITISSGVEWNWLVTTSFTVTVYHMWPEYQFKTLNAIAKYWAKCSNLYKERKIQEAQSSS